MSTLPVNPERLREIFDYDPETGILLWKRRDDVSAKLNSRCVGKIAGDAPGPDYIQIGIGGRKYLAHRIIWAMMTGNWPKNYIDHVDRNKSNNRWANLREATKAQNGANRGVPVNNTSGFKGVTFNKHVGKWQAQLGKQYLGCFDSAVDAHEKYLGALRARFAEFARSS